MRHLLVVDPERLLLVDLQDLDDSAQELKMLTEQIPARSFRVLYKRLSPVRAVGHLPYYLHCRLVKGSTNKEC